MTLVRAKSKIWVDYIFLTLVNLESHFKNICQGSTNQTRLYCSMIRPTTCVIPAENDVLKFHTLCNPILEYQSSLEAEINILLNSKTLLLSKLSKL